MRGLDPQWLQLLWVQEDSPDFHLLWGELPPALLPWVLHLEEPGKGQSCAGNSSKVSQN